MGGPNESERESPYNERIKDTDVLDRAVEAIGSTTGAMRWMVTPLSELDGATPRSVLRTQTGKKAVLEVLANLQRDAPT